MNFRSILIFASCVVVSCCTWFFFDSILEIRVICFFCSTLEKGRVVHTGTFRNSVTIFLGMNCFKLWYILFFVVLEKASTMAPIEVLHLHFWGWSACLFVFVFVFLFRVFFVWSGTICTHIYALNEPAQVCTVLERSYVWYLTSVRYVSFLQHSKGEKCHCSLRTAVPNFWGIYDLTYLLVSVVFEEVI